jgi:hypothetical protein
VSGLSSTMQCAIQRSHASVWVRARSIKAAWAQFSPVEHQSQSRYDATIHSKKPSTAMCMATQGDPVVNTRLKRRPRNGVSALGHRQATSKQDNDQHRDSGPGNQSTEVSKTSNHERKTWLQRLSHQPGRDEQKKRANSGKGESSIQSKCRP